jgi:hypothetical protein
LDWLRVGIKGGLLTVMDLRVPWLSEWRLLLKCSASLRQRSVFLRVAKMLLLNVIPVCPTVSQKAFKCRSETRPAHFDTPQPSYEVSFQAYGYNMFHNIHIFKQKP